MKIKFWFIILTVFLTFTLNYNADVKAFKMEDHKQFKEIINQLEDGTITKEEADVKLKELDVSNPKNKECRIFENLDEETKTKAKEIIKQMKNGNITKEEASAKLKELGVNFPKHNELDTETKTKAKEMIEEAKLKSVFHSPKNFMKT